MPDTYTILVGLDYPNAQGNQRVEAGDQVSDLPPQSIPWLLSTGAIGPVVPAEPPVTPAEVPAPAPEPPPAAPVAAPEVVTPPEPQTDAQAIPPTPDPAPTEVPA